MSKEKFYSWCRRCGSLVHGDKSHPCDKCDSSDLKQIYEGVELVLQKEKIGELEAELAAYRWIPAGERLPEHKNKVLIYWPRYKEIHIGFLAKDESGDFFYDEDSQASWVISEQISHWMPIPPLPGAKT